MIESARFNHDDYTCAENGYNTHTHECVGVDYRELSPCAEKMSATCSPSSLGSAYQVTSPDDDFVTTTRS